MLSSAAAKAQLDALYAEIPSIDCQRQCQSACGPIEMTYVEWQRIIGKLGYEPKKHFNPFVRDGMTCPMLQGGLCSVYAMRPVICRLWGVTETMPCPWGCKPERVLSTRESYTLLQRAAVIGARDEAEREQEEKALAYMETLPDEHFKMTEALHVRPVIE